MTSKRKRTHSSASPAGIKVEDLSDHSPVSETKADNPDRRTSERDVIIITDDEEPSITSGGTTNSTVSAHGAEGQPLVNLEQYFKQEHHLWLINTLIRQPVAIGEAICHLSELPTNAKWNAKHTLSTDSGRAITIVVFGSLASINLAIVHGKATTLTIFIDLLREIDVEKLQSVYDLAQVPRKPAARRLAVLRTSVDPRSRIMNVYDLTEQLPTNPKDKMDSLGVNALIGGDVIRMDVRCVRVQVAGTFDMQFKLKAVHLLLAVPRAVDVLN